MMKWLPAVAVLLVLGSTATAQEAFKETVFDVKALTATPLNPKVLKSTEKDGIVTEEVMFHSEMDGDKSVDIFAFIAYPKGAKNLPAFVWNQGGLYQAHPHFPEFGAKRRYVGICIDFPIPGYRSTGDYPINSSPEMGDDPRKAPIYHGAVALLKTVSYLESRPEVDKDRIGMVGSSWGGFFTTLMTGLDPRIKVGSSMFGTGSMQLGNSWWDGAGNSAGHDAAWRERWRTTLDPAYRLQNVKKPMAWFTGTNDFAYWMPALMQSYAMNSGPKHLSLIPNWNHALTEPLDEQTFAWLDVHLKGAPAFIQVTPVEVVKRGNISLAQWKFSGPRQAKSAELILSYGEAGNWTSRYWSTLPAEMKDGACSVKLPRAVMPYYISGTVVDDQGFRYSTPLLLVAADPAAKDPLLGYNGASQWGGFEEDQVTTYLGRQGWPAPTVGLDAKEGKQAAVLKTGKTTLSQLYFTAGLSHSFQCFMKADKPVQVTVEVGGNFDGKAQTQQKQFQVGTEWMRVALTVTPPKALSAGLAATITVPEGATVLVDDVIFAPIWGRGTSF